MKRKIIYAVLAFSLIFSMAACNAAKSTTSDTSSTTPQANATDTSFTFTLSENARLMIGTMLLEKSDTPLSADQVTTLLTYWKAYRSLTTSGTAAQEEITGLQDQIKEELTPEQLKAIDALQIDMSSLSTIMQDLGMQANFADRQSQDPSVEATRQAMRQSGEFPSGGFPFANGQGGPPGEGGIITNRQGTGDGSAFQSMDPQQLATLQAQRQANGGDGMGDTFVLNILISYLESKTIS
jgi:uncharacterized lipoprotein YehR (DUF1307 family)